MGKTSLSLAEFCHYYNEDRVDAMLVICPNSFKQDWVDAPAEWGVPQLVGSLWPKAKPPAEDMRLYVCNFESARQSAYKELLHMIKTKRVFLVIDEAGAMNNPGTDTSKALLDLCKVATMVRLLDGTPQAKNAEDYFMKIKAVGGLEGHNRYAFRNRFCVMGGYMGKKVTGLQNEDEFARLLEQHSFRALKKDWRDLPPKIYQQVAVEMTPAQRKHYRAMLEEFSTDLSFGTVTADLVLTQMDKLRQISSGVLIDAGKVEQIITAKDNPKLAATRDIIAGGGNKTIVVHYYKPTGLMLREELKRKGYAEPAYISGGMQPEELAEQKRRFNLDPLCREIVVQESAGFRGHTLIGESGVDRATRMVFFENSFSYYERAQIEDRNHRGEMDQPCTYYDLIASPTDRLALNIVTRKKEAADSVDAYRKIVAAVMAERK